MPKQEQNVRLGHAWGRKVPNPCPETIIEKKINEMINDACTMVKRPQET